MLLTCSECEVQYRLDDDKLGVGGRMVRCTACGNIWFQAPEQEEPEPAARRHEEDLLTQIGITDPALQPPQATTPEKFKDVLQQQTAEAIPDVVKPLSRNFQIPVVEYRPMGMAAGQFGVFSFLLFTFLSVIFLFAVRAPMVNGFPATASLYKLLGFAVHAPGEGLRLSEMIAENRIEGDTTKLAVEAKLANISESDMDYPSLQISLKGTYGSVLQDWDFHPDKGARLKSGESVPVKLEFKDAKPDGKIVEMKVIEK